MSEVLPEPVARWLEEQSALNFLLWVGGIWLTARIMWRSTKRAIPAIKNLIALSESLERLPAWMDSTDEKLGEIRHEVLPNNGGSLRDDVVTVSLQLEQVAAQQQENTARVDELEHTITRRLEARTKPQTAPIQMPHPPQKETP